MLAVEAEKQETKVCTQQTDEGSMRTGKRSEKRDGRRESRREDRRERGRKKGRGRHVHTAVCYLSRFAMS